MLKIMTLLVCLAGVVAMFFIGYLRFEVVRGRIKNTIADKVVYNLAVSCTAAFVVSLIASSYEWAFAFIEWFVNDNTTTSVVVFMIVPVLLTFGIFAYFGLCVGVCNFGGSMKYYKLAKRARERRQRKRLKARLRREAENANSVATAER